MALVEQTGLNFGLYVGATPTLVGALRNVELSISGDSIDASHAGNFGWSTKLVGTREWSASGGTVFLEEDGVTPGIDPAAEQARAAIMNGTIITVQVRTPMGATFTGTAIVTDWTISGDYDDVMEGSFEFDGASALTYVA